MRGLCAFLRGFCEYDYVFATNYDNPALMKAYFKGQDFGRSLFNWKTL